MQNKPAYGVRLRFMKPRIFRCLLFIQFSEMSAHSLFQEP